MTCIYTGARLYIEAHDVLVPADIFEVDSVRIARVLPNHLEEIMSAARQPGGAARDAANWVLNGEMSPEWWREDLGVFVVPAYRLEATSDEARNRIGAHPGMLDLRVHPKREADDYHECTGIYFRARTADGKWGSYDIAQLDEHSLYAVLRSRGGRNHWAESIVAILFGYGDTWPPESLDSSEPSTNVELNPEAQ